MLQKGTRFLKATKCIVKDCSASRMGNLIYVQNIKFKIPFVNAFFQQLPFSNFWDSSLQCEMHQKAVGTAGRHIRTFDSGVQIFPGRKLGWNDVVARQPICIHSMLGGGGGGGKAKGRCVIPS